MDDTRINELIDIFKELAELAGGYEETKIMPNLEVIDAAPADLPANFIIISDDEGFYVPAIKAAGLTVNNGDFVNVLYIKGTEPIAFQHGSSSGGGVESHPLLDGLTNNDTVAAPPVQAGLIVGNATPAWDVLASGMPGQYVSKDNATGLLGWFDIPTVGITEFLYDLASDIGTYFQLKTGAPTGGSQTLVSSAVAASNTLVFSLATNANEPGVEFINDGVWHLHLHAQKSGPGTKEVQLKFRVYSRTSGGVETQIGTGYSESSTNLTTSEAEYNLHLAIDEVTIAITDRIVLKIYADISGAGSDPTVTVTVEGGTDARLEIPALVIGGAVAASVFPVKNRLYHSMTHPLWQEGTSFTNKADDTYFADVWNLVHNASGGFEPNITQITTTGGGAIDNALAWAKITGQEAAKLAGIVQFLENKDTVPLRDKVVSISFEASGSGVSALRAAVLSWTGTADSPTSDVVGTWGTGNPTLATNWAYANTPAASIDISAGFPTRFTVENIAIPDTATNLALFIWTPATFNANDYFEIRNVQLEIGSVATDFVARKFSAEETGVYYFLTPVKLLLSGYLPCVRAGTTDIAAYGVLPVPMRKTPVLTNASDLSTTLGTGAKQVDIVNLVTTSFITATGNVTMALSAGRDSYALVFSAATSFSGTAGDFCRVHHTANDLISTFDARL